MPENRITTRFTALFDYSAEPSAVFFDQNCAKIASNSLNYPVCQKATGRGLEPSIPYKDLIFPSKNSRCAFKLCNFISSCVLTRQYAAKFFVLGIAGRKCTFSIFGIKRPLFRSSMHYHKTLKKGSLFSLFNKMIIIKLYNTQKNRVFALFMLKIAINRSIIKISF